MTKTTYESMVVFDPASFEFLLSSKGKVGPKTFLKKNS